MQIVFVCDYLIYISAQLHQQSNRLSHYNSVVDVAALQTGLQLRKVPTKNTVNA